jgi:transposase
MGRKATKVTDLKDIPLDQLRALEASLTNKYSQNVLKTIVMSYLGVHISKIEEIIGVSRASVLSYIHKWNELGIKSINDHRGGSISSFTNEMLNYIQDTLINRDPREFGFNASTWSINRMREHLKDKYGRLYSYERMRQIIKLLNNSYKRAEYHPTLANVEDQKRFKKNRKIDNPCRKFF